MASYVLSQAAQDDINHIARISADESGMARAKTYVQALHASLQKLADFSDLGRMAHHIRSGYLRLASASHVIFYQKQAGGILISRILHERMDFLAHLQ